MGKSSLVIGAGGYVGRVVLGALRAADVDAVAAVREPAAQLGESISLREASALDDALTSGRFGQVIHLPQLTGDDVDWLLDRVDGPRWIVLSSSQVLSAVQAPGTARAIAREEAVLRQGGIVLRPTMIFGRGGDRNLTPTIRRLARWRLPIVAGDGEQLVEPVHVDDIAGLIIDLAGIARPSGVYGIGGGSAVSLRELVLMLRDLVGVRTPLVRIPVGALRLTAAAAPLLGLRADQILRLMEDKVADDATARTSLGYRPELLAHRLEQAVTEALRRSSVVVPGRRR